MMTDDPMVARIAKLKVDRASGDPAPHKPLLLLVVLELAEQGLLTSEILPLTPELAFRFFTYWNIVAHRRNQRPDIRLPFHHLQSDGFWTALDEDGNQSIDRKTTRFARLSTSFRDFVRSPLNRENAIRVLIAKYFRPHERIALYALVGFPVPTADEQSRDASLGSASDAKAKGREARFRLNVVAAYNYTCALTGYRLTTLAAGSIVDAAHIHQFANSQNNDPRNGIALCKNAHWLFDNGLWSISDNFKVVVAVNQFSEDSPEQKSLASYHGQSLRLPTETSGWPSLAHTAWHRKHRFRGV